MKPTIEEIRQYFLGIGSSQKTTEHVAIYSSLHLNTASTSQEPSQAPHKIVINSPESSALPASSAPKKMGQEANDLYPQFKIPISRPKVVDEGYNRATQLYMEKAHDLAYKKLCDLRTKCTSSQQYENNAKIILMDTYGEGWPLVFSLPLATKQMEREGIELNSAPADKLLKEPETFDLIFTKNKLLS